ncbi:MAG: RNA polymerase-binding protein DksA [Alphaproteobacteria bacterium]|nr:RNA polymerase-binding protein DksA [Alphaproteobacteria bacterium]
MTPEKEDYFRKLLRGRLQALLTEAGAEIHKLTDDKENLADVIDVATEESNREFTLRLRDRERVLIHKIQAALQRLEDGEYGYCINCGDDIPEKRLMARPVATHCIDCKTEAEQLERRTRRY